MLNALDISSRAMTWASRYIYNLHIQYSLMHLASEESWIRLYSKLLCFIFGLFHKFLPNNAFFDIAPGPEE